MVDTSSNPAASQQQNSLDQRNDIRTSLRSSLLHKRMALSATQQDVAASALLQQVKVCLTAINAIPNAAGCVAGYLASRGEIDVVPTLEWLRNRGCQTVLPVISEIYGAPGLLFAPFDQHTPMKPGMFNIPIPDISSSNYLTAAQLDLVLVPLVGFDAVGGRLGMGGGYYDRTFAFRQHAAHTTAESTITVDQAFVGVAHECQQVDHIPTENWDVRLQAVATDLTCYYPG